VTGRGTAAGLVKPGFPSRKRSISVVGWPVSEAFCTRVACQAGVFGEGPGTAAGMGVPVAGRFGGVATRHV
jgi:hypothetical protein